MGGLPPASCSCYNAHSCCTSSSSDAKLSPKPSENGNLEFHPPKDFVYDDEEKDTIQRDKDGANVAAIVTPGSLNDSSHETLRLGSGKVGLTGMSGYSRLDAKTLEMHTSNSEVLDPRLSLYSSNLSNPSMSLGMQSRHSFDSKEFDKGRVRAYSNDGGRSPSSHSSPGNISPGGSYSGSPDNSPTKVKGHRSKNPDVDDYTAVSSHSFGYRTSNRNASVSIARSSTSSSHSSYNMGDSSNALSSQMVSASIALGSYASKLPSTPELFVVRSQNSDDTIAGSCYVDEVQGWRPGTPRPSRRESCGDAVSHTMSRHSVMSKATIATTYSIGTTYSTKSKSLFTYNDPEQEFKDFRKSVTRMPSRASHLSVFKIPEASLAEDPAIGEISTIHE